MNRQLDIGQVRQSPKLIQRLVDADVATFETSTQLTAGATESERSVAAAFCASRRAEFLTGRSCARIAAGALGVQLGNLGRNVDRSPSWPEPLVGSISHCPGFAVAAVARASDVWALGIDVEVNEPIPSQARALVVSPAELHHDRREIENWERLLFSAKESVFKALWPRLQWWLGRDEIEVSLTMDQRFEARVQLAEGDNPLGPPTSPDVGLKTQDLSQGSQEIASLERRPGVVTVRGRWLQETDFVATAVQISSADAFGQ